MKFVITGALGHIGSYFIRFLAKEYADLQIIMIDNLTNTWSSGMTRDQLDINILEHTSTSLILEQDGYVLDNYQPGNWKFKTYLTKVQ